MADQTLTDSHNRIIGYIRSGSGGRQNLFSPANVLKGYYDPVNNKTFDASNRLIGSGNLLTMLVR